MVFQDRTFLQGRAIWGDQGGHPVNEGGEQFRSGRQAVVALAIVTDANAQTPLPRLEEEALGLGGDVELVSTGVGNVEIQLPGAQVVTVQGLNGVDPTQLL